MHCFLARSLVAPFITLTPRDSVIRGASKKVPYCTYLSFELKGHLLPFDRAGNLLRRYTAKVVQEPFTHLVEMQLEAVFHKTICPPTVFLTVFRGNRELL
jgi:hypothetical protein